MPLTVHCHFTAQATLMSALFDMFTEFKNNSKSTRHQAIASVVFMAFTAEAYLNNLGARRVEQWLQLERCGWKQKVVLLHAIEGKKAEWGAAPLQFLTEIFKLRDRLAHGKPELVEFGPFPDDYDKYEAHKEARKGPPWVREIDHGWVLSSKPKFEASIAYLASLQGLTSDDFYTYSLTEEKFSV